MIPYPVIVDESLMNQALHQVRRAKFSFADFELPTPYTLYQAET